MAPKHCLSDPGDTCLPRTLAEFAAAAQCYTARAVLVCAEADNWFLVRSLRTRVVQELRTATAAMPERPARCTRCRSTAARAPRRSRRACHSRYPYRKRPGTSLSGGSAPSAAWPSSCRCSANVAVPSLPPKQALPGAASVGVRGARTGPRPACDQAEVQRQNFCCTTQATVFHTWVSSSAPLAGSLCLCQAVRGREAG